MLMFKKKKKHSQFLHIQNSGSLIWDNATHGEITAPHTGPRLLNEPRNRNRLNQCESSFKYQAPVYLWRRLPRL